jgi:AraC family transcriptional regulator, regulatory protein of adaptative response / DNA-3-methyladenine glycosylase II
VQRIGMPGARAATVVRLAREVAAGRVDLNACVSPETSISALEAIPGIGAWTAQYIAMRALRWPDACPAGDLGVQRALRLSSARAVEKRAEAWRPWRAYAVMHLWTGA